MQRLDVSRNKLQTQKGNEVKAGCTKLVAPFPRYIPDQILSVSSDPTSNLFRVLGFKGSNLKRKDNKKRIDG